MSFPLYPKWLTESYSLEGEDRIALSLLRTIINDYGQNFFYIDIGCNDPIKYSNTYLFYKLGLHGICIDPLPESAKKFEEQRKNDTFIQAAIAEKIDQVYMHIFDMDDASTIDLETQKKYAGKFDLKCKLKVKTITLKYVMENLKIPKNANIPLLSIDVEGYDENIFSQAMNLDNRFDMIIVEDKLINLSNPYPQSKIGELAKDNGYIMISKSPLNTIYINNKSKTFEWIPRKMIDFKKNVKS